MNPLSLKLEEQKLKTRNTVKLLGITIDNKPNIEDHVPELCKKAFMQINAISRLQRLSFQILIIAH